MLAVVGFILTQYVHLPGDQFQAGPLEALSTVPVGAHAQVFTCEWSLVVLVPRIRLLLCEENQGRGRMMELEVGCALCLSQEVRH